MALRIRRGTTVERLQKTFDLAEPVWDTTEKQLYVGDGTTAGGVSILANANSLVTSVANKTGDVQLATDDIFENNSLFYTPERAVAAVGINLENVQHDGIQFSYVDGNIIATVTAGAGGGITSVSEDLEPTLGGGLDLNTHDITGIGNINITGSITASTDITAPTFVGNLSGNVSDEYGHSVTTSTINQVTLHTDYVDFRGSIGYLLGTQINVNTNKVVFSNDTYSSAPWFSVGSWQGSNAGTSPMAVARARGTISVPAAVQTADGVLDLQALAHDGTGFQLSGAIKCTVAGAVATGSVPGKWTISASTGSSLVDTLTIGATDVTFATRAFFPDGTAADPSIAFTTDGGFDSGFSHPGDGIIVTSINATEKVRVDSGGMRIEGFMKVGGFATGSLPSPAEAGMIALDTTTGEFKGYNGSAWVVLG